MKKPWGRTGKGACTSTMLHLTYYFVIFQFLFKFSQGQGPGFINQHFNISENLPPNSEVGVISSQSFYTYAFSESSTYFRLDPNTGKITTKVVIDREHLNLPENQFNILVIATSSSGENYPVEITIEILDQNDNSPTFPSENVQITFRESSGIGLNKYIETATDVDIGQNALVNQYDIISGSGPFRLVFNPDLYGDVLIVQPTGELDRETRSQYTLVIRARDSGSPQRTGTATLSIIISDENDNPPIFDPSTYHAQVNETDPIGTRVVKVLASDRDIGPNQDITYMFTDDNAETVLFNIEANTGEIFTAVKPLSCPGGQCLLRVEARDNGVPWYSGRAFVYVSIVDTNNHDPEIVFKHAPDESKDFSSVNENAVNGNIVAGVLTSDKDDGKNGQTSARIISGNELGHFSFRMFDSDKYYVVVNGDGVLDRERYPMYNITIEAKDNGSPPRTSTKVLVIYVNDINDHKPVFTKKSVTVQISETTKVGSFIESMIATDLDTDINAQLTYKIETGNTPEWFKIDKDTGLVTTKDRLRFEVANRFYMNISVHDGALDPFSDYAALNVEIWDENDMAPQFDQTVFNVSLNENIASVARVVLASAVDNDSGVNGTVKYAFMPEVEILYPNTFHLDVDTGDLTTKRSLDREEVSSYVLRVTAHDMGPAPLTSTATIYLKVNDINDNSPIFYPSNYYAKIMEGQSVGTTVTKVTAVDADEGNNAIVTYTFSSSDFGKFALDSHTGLITTTSILQHDQRSSYTLTVRASDQASSQASTATVHVSVRTPTDPQPAFTRDVYTIENIPEDPSSGAASNVGRYVGQVTATADTSGVNIEYSIVAGDQDRIFNINGGNGQITRAKMIDREMYDSFDLKVIATVGDKFAEATVRITVQDVNDNAPTFDFPNRDIELLESWPVGHYIAVVSAKDIDAPGPNSRVSYSLQQDHSGMFVIESNTGLLYLNKPIELLGTDSVTLTVIAVDAGTKSLNSTQQLHLKVKDVNDHTPKFPHTTYEMSLIESEAVSTRFFLVRAYDQDIGANGALTYNITRGNEDKKFGLFPDGNLFIAKSLDRETKDFYKISIRAKDNGVPPRSSECNITIHITDYNDNKPIFLNATYAFEVLEDRPSGSYVGQVFASDADMGRNAELSYSFRNSQSDFKIDAQTGEITTLVSFDREKLEDSGFMVVFDVAVRDNGVNSLEDIATVRVKILDVNDNAPRFRQHIYSVSLFENAPTFSNVTVVKAEDLDSGINSIVTYSIIHGNDDGNFVIDATTGQITLNKLLDRETIDSYKLTILGTDSGINVRHNATCKVHITVKDINDNFPLFAQSQMDTSVPENKKPGEEVAYFPATDIDQGVNAEITYTMSGADHDGTFGIDQHTGRIYLLKELDYEHKRNYRLNVTATDNGVPPLPYYIRFSITIEDVNDNPPVFRGEPITCYSLEHSSGAVCDVKADDADSGKNGEVQYHIVNQDPHGDHFKIVKNTGQIYIDREIDREVADMYTLIVAATDQAEDESKRLSTEARVTISINDINDNSPVITSFNAVAVPRTTPRNEYVTTLTAFDADIGDNKRMALQLQNSANMFTVDSSTGRILLTQSLTDTPVKYPVTVVATDYGKPSQRTSQFALTIIVTDNSQGPVFQGAPYTGSIVENNALGIILTVNAVSRKNSAVEYYITNITDTKTGAQTERHFQINKNTGVLTPVGALDREKIGSEFSVEIYAIDTEGTRPTTSVTIAKVTVLDQNDTPPRFSRSFYEFDVSEDARMDFPIARLSVYDEDEIGGLSYNIENLPANAHLKINVDGSIVTTGPLDHEVTPKFTLNISANDGKQSSYCLVRINVLDINDNAPIFTSPFYSFDIAEDTSIGTTVGSVMAEDPDEGLNGVVTYIMTSGWGNDTFDLDSKKGTFTLRRVLDFEENQLYTLRISARDSGADPKTSSVLVYFNVKDTNDNTPLFEHGTYDVAIYENVTIGTSVVQVAAIDVDSGENGEISYDIISDDIINTFTIDPDSGAIYTTINLDRETTPSYTLTVMATDKASNPDQRRSATAEVLIAINDVNDYTPEFLTPPIIHVRENTPRNTVVHSFTIQDLDEGINSEVFFSMQSIGGVPFTLGQNDGKLRVIGDLDRESVQNYSMSVTVRDKGTPSLSATQALTVIIEDENDHDPVFFPEYYETDVTEDIPIGTQLLQVSATDVDIGLNGIVKYYVLSGDDNHDLSLDQSSGILRVQKSLDYERVTDYKLIIQAEDSGDVPNYSTATVSVAVADVNDNEPVFLDSPFIGFVRENMDQPVFVLQVTANDSDSAPFNHLQYSIREGDRSLFNMSSTTGDIMALHTLDREQKSFYVLTVVATDSVTGRGLTGSGTVSVFVEDVNDNPPIFEHTGAYIAHVPENANENTEVIVVKATDRDEGANAQIIYSLKDSINDKFMIYPDTGRIATRVPLDREEVMEYTLEVIAMDTSIMPLSSSAMVHVYVDDVNDNSPDFEHQSYARTLKVPASAGTFVLGVTATDVDKGDNRVVSYSLARPDSASFNIHQQTGVITLKQSVSAASSYNFDVIATDKGSPALSATVSVSVTMTTTSGTTPPTFGQMPTSLVVIENTNVNSTVTKVTAQSSNGASIAFSIAGGNIGEAFGIEEQSGRVFVKGVVDYELMTVYNLWIKAKQGSTSSVSSYAQLTINIQDENDNKPKFSKTVYEVSIKEDALIGSSLVTVTATDADANDNGAITFKLGGPDASLFMIDSTGRISTFTAMDRETVDKYSLTVVATDKGSTKQTSTASVHVTVLDVNDNPPSFSRQFRVEIPENMQVGSYVLHVTSSDRDIGENAVATYSLTDDANGTFSIEGVSGNITLRKPLDAEAKSTYRLRVSAVDGSYNVGGNVQVDIMDINDNNPIVEPPYSFDFTEMMPGGSTVGQLQASDADMEAPNNQVYFSLKLTSNYFTLDSDTGEIMSLEELTFDPTYPLTAFPNRHELIVIAKDLGTPARSSERMILINVKDYNDHAPVFEHQRYRSAVPESTAPGNSIVTVQATDELDYGDNAVVEYFISGGNGTSYFSIDRVSGIISVATSLAGKKNQEFQVMVKAEDLGKIPMSATVPVNLVVTDVNTQAPTFTAPSTLMTSIEENKQIGSLIEKFAAHDIDYGLNAEIEFRITGGNEEDLFSMDLTSGELRVKGVLDYETQIQYSLQITVSDKALHPKHTTTSYLVRLIDVNDNDPKFVQDSDVAYIDENVPRGTSVYQAVAVDIDSGNNKVIEYHIVGDTQFQSVFQIDSTTGLITTKGDIDYESVDTYTLTIMAINRDSVHKSTMTLVINVEGVNEDVPRFVRDEYFFSISESAETKTSVGKVHAEDNDAGPDGIVNYFLIGDSNVKGFKVDPRTGDILVSGKPDYESSPRITLQVLAKNWGSIKGNDTDTCTVHITVEDANDPPIFEPSSYHGTVTENSRKADVSIVTVTAKDYDFDAADRTFSYTILAGNSGNRFKINSQNGLVSTTGNGDFDRETVGMYNVTVGAIDTGSPPETGSATVYITVLDVNDNGPYFVNFTATVAEEQSPPAIVTSLPQFTRDLDGPSNQGPYRYNHVPGTHTVYEYFFIESNGQVKTKKRIDREQTAHFTVPVLVSDAGIPSMTSTLTFKVNILDIEDNPPKPRYATVYLALFDGNLPSTPIADVRPLDEDITGTYRCTLDNHAAGIFQIQQNTCNLRVNQFPTNSSYTLRVLGQDGLTTPVSYDIEVHVVNFNNATIKHSTILQVADMKAEDFMANIFNRFISAVQNLFLADDKVKIFGLTQQASGDLLVHLAVTSFIDNTYYTPSILRQKLQSAMTNGDFQSIVFLTNIAYSACVSNQCKNGGTCASHVDVKSTNHIADSTYLIFSNPDMTLTTYCVCPSEYTGLDCSLQATPCGSIYCQNGGTCTNQKCQCPLTWTGPSCEQDINECQLGFCGNGATCENLPGDYKCTCREGYFGKNCSEGQNSCQSSPCVHGTCENLVDRFRCLCDYGYFGERCHLSSLGFEEASYIEHQTLVTLTSIDVTFATTRANSLLLYNPSSSNTNFLALEVINGRVQFSVSLTSGQVTRVAVSKQVNTGAWFNIKIARSTETVRIWVADCPEDGTACAQCQVGTACYNQSQIPAVLSLGLGTQPLVVGGIRQIFTITNRTGQVSTHDFVGCVREFNVNNKDVLRPGVSTEISRAHVTNECPRSGVQDVCVGHRCDNGGSCVSEWAGAMCHCTPQYMGDHCETALKPVGFGPDSFVTINMRETARRDALMASASGSRRRRATTPATSSVMVRFRTTAPYGVLVFASTGSNAYSILSVFDGELKFTTSQFGGSSSVVIDGHNVANGVWYNATVTITANEVALSLNDKEERKTISTFLFNSPDVVKFSLGGAASTSPITVDNQNLKDFAGCMSIFMLDGEHIPMIGETDRYRITASKGIDNGCASLCSNNACDGRDCSVQGEAIICAPVTQEGALSIGIIIMIVFFVILIIVIVVVFVVCRRHGQKCLKGKQAKQNGANLSKNPNNSAHSNPDSGFGENNFDELIIRNHIAQELAGSNYHRQNGHGHMIQPDIIKSDIGRTPMPLEIEDGTVIIDNASDLTNFRDLNGEVPEHYDIENASSIAPSDIDIVDHYRHFHDGGKRRKTKAHSDHSRNSKPSSRHYNHSNHSTHSAHQIRDSPNLLSSVPFMNDLARNSPSSRTHSPAVNQLSRNSPNVRQSPLTHMNMHGHGHHNMPITDLNGGSRTTSERSLASHRSKQSSSTPNKPKRQMLPNGQPGGKLLNHNYENSKFLTKEEVDRLNARPRDSPHSLVEAFSTSSENNTRRMQRPFEPFQDTSVLLEPPESSSEDSANDSFTCSEFEYENDKPRNDFIDQNHRKFKNIKEETEEEGAYHNKNFRADGLDSGGNSFSSNERSSDENQALAAGLKNTAFNWDDLLNWGPKFEKLVGVFTDIALLPDADNVEFPEMDTKSTDREEYV